MITATKIKGWSQLGIFAVTFLFLIVLVVVSAKYTDWDEGDETVKFWDVVSIITVILAII